MSRLDQNLFATVSLVGARIELNTSRKGEPEVKICSAARGVALAHNAGVVASEAGEFTWIESEREG